MNCEKCGTILEEYHDGHSFGYTCPNCGWGLATSLFEPYETDQAQYSITIFGNEATLSAVKTISAITGVNFLQAKQLLAMPEATIFEGKAVHVLHVKKALVENGLSFKITPDFPY